MNHTLMSRPYNFMVNSNYALVVGGDILSAGLNIKVPSQWPDYVFDNSYPLTSLGEVEQFIKVNGHLPNIPSAEDHRSRSPLPMAYCISPRRATSAAA